MFTFVLGFFAQSADHLDKKKLEKDAIIDGMRLEVPFNPSQR